MPLDYALIVTLRSRTAYGGATHPVARTGNCVSHDEVTRLLQNWAHWASDYLPELGYQPPPWADQFIPRLCWDSGWGDPVPLDLPPPAAYEPDALRVDKAIMSLAIEHVLTLKRHYINHRKQERERLDAAIRALGDVL